MISEYHIGNLIFQILKFAVEEKKREKKNAILALVQELRLVVTTYIRENQTKIQPFLLFL